jgi:lipopolysaccharide transport system ATP-binding protein
MSVIKVENISKKYSIVNVEKELTLRDKLFNKFRAKKEDRKSAMRNFWALKNIDFKINQGEVVGIIGSNGAGKSTLLKVISRITTPTTGRISISGNVSSLLEVGTGFHPELSGKDNIFLNGAILGMNRREIVKRFDEIVFFSGIEKFLNTPVKHYSTGMYLRLAFSVAAHLESDILLVDEVLAVGDIEFQKKCLQKMGDIVKNTKKTIIFVSHNLAAIQKLCSKSILLEGGELIDYAETGHVIDKYLGESFEDKSGKIEKDNHKYVQITNVKVASGFKDNCSFLDLVQPFEIRIDYEIRKSIEDKNYVFVEIYDAKNNLIINSYDVDSNEIYYSSRNVGHYKTIFKFPKNLFNEAEYRLRIGCGAPGKYSNSEQKELFFDQSDNIKISFYNSGNFADKFFRGRRNGSLLIHIPSEIKKL